MLKKLKHWFRTRGGGDPASRAETNPRPSTAPEGAGEGSNPSATPVTSPQDILAQGLASKVLHGWLQNQHQTLVPMTLRLNQLEPEHTRVLMRFAAVAFLSGTNADEGRRVGTERWFRSVGADDHAIAGFFAALEAPEPLSELLDQIRTHKLESYAYVAAVVAADQRDLSGRLFSNYAAAKFKLPADAVRSIERRYRR